MAKPLILLRVLGLETTMIELVSPLKRSECVSRLGEHVDKPWSITKMRPVFGTVDESSFTLRQRTGYRNSFHTVLHGTLHEESRETRIRCRFSLNPLVRGIMLLWLAGILAAECLSMVRGARPGTPPSLDTIAGLALMFCFGIALLKFGRHLARDQEPYLLAFVTRWLEAREAPPT